jgi:predicted nuclease of predicted toxin-antitoxin system
VRYLVDECLGLLFVIKLRDMGHDVEWVRDGAEGIPDETVLEWSVRTERVLVTEDFDYGDLIFAKGHLAVAVVILQLSDFPGSWEAVATKAVERLTDKQSEFLGNLTVLGRTRFKSRALPAR